METELAPQPQVNITAGAIARELEQKKIVEEKEDLEIRNSVMATLAQKNEKNAARSEAEKKVALTAADMIALSTKSIEADTKVETFVNSMRRLAEQTLGAIKEERLNQSEAPRQKFGEGADPMESRVTTALQEFIDKSSAKKLEWAWLRDQAKVEKEVPTHKEYDEQVKELKDLVSAYVAPKDNTNVSELKAACKALKTYVTDAKKARAQSDRATAKPTKTKKTTSPRRSASGSIITRRLRTWPMTLLL